MALVLANRVQETATANTTVSFTLTGAIQGFQTFAAVGDTNTTYYSATDAFGNWEVGLGTYSTTGPTLTRTTVYASSNSGLAVTFSGTVNVFLTYPSGRSVNLDASGNVSALGTVASGTWQGSTVGVAYGGTGVTTSSGANSVVLRDSNQNITVNRISQGTQAVTAAGGTTILTAASQFNQTLTGTGGQTYRLPDATTLTDTTTFQFNNNATGTLTITDYASATIGTVAPGGAAGIALLDNSTTGGTWDVHAYIPENVTWGTNSLALGSTVITGGTWNGGTISSAYGGTGLTTFAGANNALYSTSASALAAGTLPVAAGGTGNTSGQATSVANSLTINNGGAGDASGTTYNGSAARTISYNTVGAPSTTGTNASGTWNISISGNAATVTNGLTTSNYSSYSTFTGKVTSGGNNGFANDVYYSGVRNPIWYFGNASTYGISYFQGSAGIGGADAIGLHPNGTATATGSAFAVTPSASYVNNNVVLHAGNYNSYAPTLTGGGASGTWGINITGSAGSAGSVDYNNLTNKTGGTGTYTTSGDYRAPIFYDSNNTGYYVDPAGTSNVNIDVMNKLIAGGLGSSTLNTIGGNIGSTGLSWNNAQLEIKNTDAGTVGIAFHRAGYTSVNLYSTGSNLQTDSAFYAPIFYDSNDASYYGDFASSTTSIKAAGAFYQGSLLSRPYVQWGEGGSVTGAIVIQLPGTTSNYGMVHIVIDIYEYSGNNVTTVVIGGHNWYGSWYNYGANVIGYTDKPIRLCVVGGRFAVVIGNDSSTWNYGQVFVRKINNGPYYSGTMDLGGSYSIYRTTSVGPSWDSGDLNSFRSTTITGTSSVRAPIFYDSNNTGYYVDPNGITNLGGVNDRPLRVLKTSGVNSAATIFENQYGDNSWGIVSEFRIGSGSGTDSPSILFSQGYNSNTWSVGFGLSDTDYFRIKHDHGWRNGGWGTTDWYCDRSGNTWSVGSSRAPIFYDSNDTGYYVDPASTSLLNYAYGLDTTFVAPGSRGTYVWVRAPMGGFNDGGDIVKFTISRSIFSDGSNPYGGPSADITAFSREWHSGQEFCTIVYGEHGSGSGTGGYYISHAGPRDLAGSGYWFYMRLEGGITYKVRRAVSSGYIGNFSATTDPGSVPAINNWGLNILSSGSGSPSIYSQNNITASGNVTAYSDESLKKDWASVAEDYIERLALVKAGTYTRIDSGERQAGSSAQDWQKLLPEVVSGQEILSLAYGNAALVSAIELAKRVVEQEARTKRLETLIEKLIGDVK